MITKTITPRGNSFQATVRHNGERARRSFKTRHDAEVWALQTEANLLVGKVPDMKMLKAVSRPKTLAEVVDSVVKHKWAGTRSEHTHEINAKTVMDYFGPTKPLEDIDEEQIDEFVLHLREQDKKNGTINRKLSALSVIVRHAYKRRWITRVPMIERRTERLTRISYYSKEEQETIIQAFEMCGDADYARLFIFLCDTGIRMHEALSLTYRDVRPYRGGHAVFIHGGRQANSPDRMIPLTTRASQAIDIEERDKRRRCDGTGYEAENITHSSDHGPFIHMTKRSARSAWERVREALGRVDDPDFVWHTCRHTFCSLMLQAGESLPVVRSLAGHKSITTTVRYAHMSPLNSVDAIKTLEAYK